VPLLKQSIHQDIVSAVSFHPYMPYIATCSGQHKFDEDVVDNSLQFYAMSE
jgi:hypothetical protein